MVRTGMSMARVQSFYEETDESWAELCNIY